MLGPRFWSKKQLDSLGPNCTKWVNERHRPAGFEPWIVPDLSIPLIPTLIGLRVIDLVSSSVWWEAMANTYLPFVLAILMWNNFISFSLHFRLYLPLFLFSFRLIVGDIRYTDFILCRVVRTRCKRRYVLGMTLNCIWWWDSCFVTLGNVPLLPGSTC